MSNNPTNNWAGQVRRAWIEHHASKHGKINRSDIIAMFGVSHAVASADLMMISTARPKSLVYDASLKKYIWLGGKPTAPPAPIRDFE